MTATAKELSHLWAVEQVQRSLECAAMAASDGKPASIKSISESIRLSNALSFLGRTVSLFSCSVSIFSCSIYISLAGSRRQ